MKSGSFIDGPPPADAGLFGFYLEESQQQIVVIGVPWEVTTSYGRGTAAAPDAIVKASHQLDLFDPQLQRSFGQEVAMLPISEKWRTWNRECSALALPIIEAGGRVQGKLRHDLEKINQIGDQLNVELRCLVASLLEEGKRVAILGGDHASPYGSILAHFDRYPGMGILHFDAHADLRVAYEGFLYSHASIMYNLVHEIPELAALVSVGVRDFSEDEAQIAENHPSIHAFYDHLIQAKLFQGCSWHAICQEILKPLPKEVYVSFDIDGLDPACCPHTGTPVPGGLSFNQAVYLLEQVVASGRKIVGFDLVEVAPNAKDPDDEWDTNVGARLLHRLASLTYRSNGCKM
ncbi:MAG: agmatinase family protein [Acidobacteria bacterium]|nr:agmatinase family protein [Acidobacteriota bacterium]MCB9397726.1 agmatinase family protein [Acidobacteriota bacterium]